MEAPKVDYDKNVYEHIRSIKRDKKADMVCNLDVLGQGAAGRTYSANIKPIKKFPNPIVLKEQKRNRYCLNEFEALKYLREKMMAEKLPGYYIFMYGCFSRGNEKWLIIEKADKCLDDYFVENDLTVKQYLEIFWHVANAVSYLEADKFNHGDLWSENVMLSWLPDQEDLDDNDKKFMVKIIDYDSAFKANTSITSPSYGGADKFRKKFIIGYDLNRFFDGLIYSYENYIEKKTRHKKTKIAKLKKMQKQGKQVHIPELDDQDSSDEEFDKDNIIYPPEIIKFMYDLGPSDPNVFDDCPNMSGEKVKQIIEEYAEKLGIVLGE